MTQEDKTVAIIRNIEIDGRQIPFKASAAIPRIYRVKYRRDIFKDLEHLMDSISQNLEDGDGQDGEISFSMLAPFTLEIFENIAYLMAKHADPDVPDSVEEWLDAFNTFSVYEVMPQLIELWQVNVETDVESKKKLDRLTGR